MTIYKGNNKQKDIYIGSVKIDKVYKGSTLVYQSKLPAGQVIFESATPGTYTVIIPTTQTFYIDLVGGGGGTAHSPSTSISDRCGGSGARIYGNIYLSAGSYTLIVGAGGEGSSASFINFPKNSESGYDSSFLNNIAGGGGAGYNSTTKKYGDAGSYNIVTSGLTGITGQAGGVDIFAHSVYDGTTSGYGAGGNNSSHINGYNGYAKIITV